MNARRPSGFRWLAIVASFAAISACSGDSQSPTGPGPDPQPEPYDHLLGPGASAADLLASTDFDSLVVQIQYLEGFRPTDEGVQHLEDLLNARLNKPRGISIEIESIQFTPRATYSVADARAIEDQHRTAYTEGRTLAIYFLFLDGEFSDQANVLGFAHRNTSMVIFEEKIRDNSGGTFEPSTATVEGVVLMHEIGHNLGLVNNGSAMQSEHQDEPNGKHCDNDNCLMYFAVRTTDFISNLLNGIPDLDQNCIDDLQANGGK